MSPPINIDGSQVSGITIDGESVSEVTVDGDVVFSAIPDSGVARYRFEQDLTNSWNDNGGTGSGGISFQQGGQEPDGSYYALLDGTDDYVTTTLQFGSTDDFSFVGWVYFESFASSYNSLVAQRDSFSTMDWTFYHDTESASDQGYRVALGDSLSSIIKTGITESTGVWRHIALTKGGDTYTFYRDAAQDYQETDSQSWTPSDSLYLGSWEDGNQLSNIRADLWDFYAKELTATEVQNHYDTGSISG